jgi:glycosyltransferase involved in cell wall biosynthesis
VRPFVTRSAVNVAPLRIARGTQNKILEAMATATPVVATPAGSAGLDATPGQHLLVAADVDGIAAAVLQLLDDPALARRLGTAGRQCVEARYDLRAVARVLESLYADAIASFSPVAAAPASAGAA